MDIERLTADTEDFNGEVWHIKEINTLVDAGTGDSWGEIKELDDVDTVLLTHSHYDHVDNLGKIVDKFSPTVYAYAPENLAFDAEKVSEGDNIEIKNIEFKVFHTPGHKDDSVCFYSESEKILFAGDLLFPDGGFGRTDLEEGNRDLLIKSIEKISELDVERMYTGHGEAVKENTNQQIMRSLEEAKMHEAKY